MSLAATLLLVAACASDGRELRAPDPGATTPTTASQPSAGFEPSDERPDFVFVADAFDDGGAIPVEHTCDGEDRSPALSWNGVPVGAAELAVIVEDPDAQFFTHWVIAGLSPNSTGLPAGEVPDGAVEAFNDFGTIGWRGPCPPEQHRYTFSLHVLPEPLGMASELDAATAVGLIQTSTIQAVSFSGVYGPATG